MSKQAFSVAEDDQEAGRELMPVGDGARGRAAPCQGAADPAHLDPGVLRGCRHRGGSAERHRRPAARQVARQRAHGRSAGRRCALSREPDAEPDHRRDHAAARADAGRTRPARRVLRCRHQGRRDRPHQRRGALSRAAEARRERISDRADRRRCSSSRACPTSTTIPIPIPSATSSPSSAPRAASARAPCATTRRGRCRRF